MAPRSKSSSFVTRRRTLVCTCVFLFSLFLSDENWMVGWLCAELQAKEGNVSLVFGGRCGEERMDGWMGLLTDE